MRSIIVTILHPDYDPTVIGPHDIAILKLSSPFVLNHAVNLIELPRYSSIPTGDGIIVGWGSISTTNESIMPDVLQVSIYRIKFSQLKVW